jgi:hypothetical protein
MTGSWIRIYIPNMDPDPEDVKIGQIRGKVKP